MNKDQYCLTPSKNSYSVQTLIMNQNELEQIVQVQIFLFTSVEMTAKRDFQDTVSYSGYSFLVWKSFIMTHGIFVL